MKTLKSLALAAVIGGLVAAPVAAQQQPQPQSNLSADYITQNTQKGTGGLVVPVMVLVLLLAILGSRSGGAGHFVGPSVY